MIKGIAEDVLKRVYDFSEMTNEELRCKFFQKLQECIDLCNNTSDILDWIKNEGIEKEVSKFLNTWKDDGTLDKIINIDKINALKTELLNTINENKTSLDNEIANIISQITTDKENIYNQINKIYNDGLRKCKATFGFSAIGSACSDCKTLEDEIVMLNKFKEIGITSFSCCMYVNEADGTFDIEDNTTMLDGIINYCKENNLSIPVIKLHFKNINTIDNSFYGKLENLIVRLNNIFKVINYETLFLWNERTDDLRNNYLTSALTTAAVYCTNVLKVKAAIALQGYTPIGLIKDNKALLNALNVIGINHYPHISAKGEDTVIADSINGWKDSCITENIKYIKNLKPNLDVYISESGLIASWRALCDPGHWSFDWQTYDNNTGKVCEIFYTGMFEVLKNEDIPYIFGWFPHDFVKNVEVAKKMYDKYYNGGR